jgi:hypothetical protein
MLSNGICNTTSVVLSRGFSPNKETLSFLNEPIYHARVGSDRRITSRHFEHACLTQFGHCSK